MNNRKKDSQDSINEAMNTLYTSEQANNESVQSTQNNQTPPEENPKTNRKISFDKWIKTTGIVLIIASMVTMFFISTTPSINTSDAAKQAIREKISTSLSAGTTLMLSDETIGVQDYTVTHDSVSDESKVWIWDYAAEDGDYVQILVDGAPIGNAFMIKNKPREFKVPTTGTVQIKGIKDGGGGITYAVKYECNHTSYFNSAPEGECNTYTLVRN
jgi:hypothetical protein